MSNERWREGDRNKEGWERFEEFDKRGGEGGGGGVGGLFGKFSKRGRGCLNKRWEHNEWGCDKQQRFNLKG